MMYYDNNNFGFPWLIFGWLAFWLFIVIVVFMLVGTRHWRHHYRGGYWHDQMFDDPIEIVKMRYAKGEINKEEFERLKKDLQDKS
jgi:putative membrane protein